MYFSHMDALAKCLGPTPPLTPPHPPRLRVPRGTHGGPRGYLGVPRGYPGGTPGYPGGTPGYPRGVLRGSGVPPG